MHELLFLPLLLYLFTGGGECSQECYVCRPPEEMSNIAQKVLHQFPNQELPVCGRQAPTPRRCPHNYNGCLTQYHGELVVRLCGELKITACEVANGVEYCYCEGQLCNLEERRKHPVRPGGARVDDEDSEEDGSGSGAMPPGTATGGSSSVVEVPEAPEHHPASTATVSTTATATATLLTVLLVVF